MKDSNSIVEQYSIPLCGCLVAFIGLYASACLTFYERNIKDISNDMLQNPVFKTRILLLVLMSFLFLTLVYIMYSQKSNKEFYLYWICVGFIFLAFLIRYPIRSWQAEPYWETSTNFIWQTYNRGPIKSILLDDSGYWVLLPRLLSIIVIFMLKQMKYAPFLLQGITILFWCFTCAKFIKKEFNNYCTVEIRFATALFWGISTYFTVYQIVSLHNVAYIGGMLMLLCCIMDMNEVSKPIFILDVILIFLSCCSKMHLCVIAPIAIALLLVFKHKLHVRLKFLLYSCLTGNMLMVLYHLSGISESATYGLTKDIGSVLLTTFHYFIQSFTYFFKNYNKNGYYGGFIYNFAIISILTTILAISIQKRNRKSIIGICLGIFSIGVAMMNALSKQIPIMITDFKQLFTCTSYYPGRNGFLGLFAVYLLCIVFISNYLSQPDKKILEKIILLCVMCFLMFRFSVVPESLTNLSCDLNWKKYSFCLNNNSYGIPAGASKGMFLLKNARVKYWGNEDVTTYNGHFAAGVSKITKLEDTNTHEIFLESKENIVSVYANKFSLKQTEIPAMLLLDQNGQVVYTIKGISETGRYTVGFILNQPCKDIMGISFVDSITGEPYYMASDIYVVVEDPGKGIIGDGGWGSPSLEE